MKKYFYSFSFLLGVSFVSAQTFVNTEVEKRHIVLEKFTGINCGACPGGDQEIAQLAQIHGEKFMAYAFHTFGDPQEGQPDFGTQWGDAVAGQAQATGYPAGNINRIPFEEYAQNAGGTAMSKGDWAAAIDSILDEDAYVNVGAKFEYDTEFNTVTVKVELYYTTTPGPDNRLNVAVIQNHVLGPQAGGGAGDEYEHNHMMREFLTGQWGEDLTGVEAGAFIEKEYTWELPEDIRDIELVAEDLEIIAFVSEGSGEINNGAIAEPEFIVKYDVNPAAKKKANAVCSNSIAPKFDLTNFGEETINTLDIEYTINGTSYDYEWTGTLPTFDVQEVELPAVTFTPLASNNLTIEIKNPNQNSNGFDEGMANNTIEEIFEASEEYHSYIHFQMKLDGFANKTSWELINHMGEVMYEGGPYDAGSIETINEVFELEDDLCYQFRVIDEDGNGLMGGQNQNDGSTYPAGFYKISVNGATVQEGVNFDDLAQHNFSIDMATVSLNELDVDNVVLYPNPASDVINIQIGLEQASKAQFELTNQLGQVVYQDALNMDSGSNMIQLPVSELSSGFYLVNIRIADKQITKKVMIE
jgi:hypothetical protein